MKDNFKELPALSGPPQYQSYLRERLETLSVRESYILAAVLQRAPPRNAEEAVETAARLDCYEFVEIDGFRETVEKKLLAKGFDKRVLDLCFDLNAYVRIVHNFASSYTSQDTGLYVHRNYDLSPLEEGMTMQ